MIAIEEMEPWQWNLLVTKAKWPNLLNTSSEIRFRFCFYRKMGMKNIWVETFLTSCNITFAESKVIIAARTLWLNEV